jgi:DNA processing protein
MNKNTLQYWLALLRAPGIGAITGQKLLTAFPNIANLFAATAQMLSDCGLTKKTMDGIKNPRWELIEQDLNWLKDTDHHLLTIQDELYPSLLKEIADPPLALFVEGSPQILSAPQLGIVGSRNPSHTGLDNAHDFAKFLAGAGLTITSGLALGIDAESHKGALEVNGKTIAVMGLGLDKIYPANNKALARNIVQNGGALVSEYSIATPVKAENFPRRNRIISGLSIGILVVEASIRSGSLITARLATEQGREVFAIPGSIHNPLARGCHTLIRQGAKLIETAQDILEELGPLSATFGHLQSEVFSHPRENGDPVRVDSRMRGNDGKQRGNYTERGKNENKLDSEYQKLLEYIGYETTPVDVLVERSGFTASNISSMLLILELQGHIKSTVGGYIKVC